MDNRSHQKAWYKSAWVLSLIGVFSVLLIFRIAAPYALEVYANKTLDETKGISGSIGDIDLHLYRGAYEIESIKIYQESLQGKSEPLLMVDRLDISVLWSALFRGKVVSELMFSEPKIYILDKAEKQDIEDEEIKDEETWISLSNSLAPFSIDRIELRNGSIRLKNIDTEINAETRLSDVNGFVLNITNSQEQASRLATFHFDAKLMDEATLKLSGSVDPFALKPTFDFDMSVERFAVKHIDALIKFYTPIDLEAGQIDGSMEMRVNEGKVDGYVKAGIFDVTVFSWKEDVVNDGDNPFSLLFEGITAAISELFENDKKDLIATTLPLSGTIGDTETSTLEAILGLLKNAFIEANNLQIDKSLSLQEE
ncbi:DUF748 domain-containing protein [Aliiglaciecola litoralis]|uniref:DUF748 domain-containing protein n=1 Tax=Aliiglaciecola litoralis TaxID=582857 RepID=A0ABN1LRH9_9ALTE